MARASGGIHRIGVISDTHGLLRPEVPEAFRDVELILHAGDIGSADVIAELKRIARVLAVRGNVDQDPWSRRYRASAAVEIGAVTVYLLHDLSLLDLEPADAGIQVVIYGHSHRPAVERKGDVLYFNPGSAGPRRFHNPVTVGLLTIRGNAAQAEIIPLEKPDA